MNVVSFGKVPNPLNQDIRIQMLKFLFQKYYSNIDNTST
jgi:hypothetical protein